MGKSSRIVVLSVFSVLTLCVFLALLAVRPGIQNDILAQARARQAQSLVDVNEPLETDPQTVSEAEAFADEVRQILLSDESFRSDVANSVASDPAFIESVSSQIRADVEEYVSSAVDAYIAENREAFLSAVDEKIVSYVDANYDAAIGIIRNEIDSYAEDNYSALTGIIRTEIDSYVTDHYDELVSLIISEASGEDINEEELVNMLTGPVSDEILAQITSYIDSIDFDGLKAELQGEIDAFDAQLREYVDSKSISEDEIRAIVDASLGQWQSAVADEVTERVMDRIGDRLVSAESESGSDVPAKAGRVISTPDFTGLPEVTVQDEYASARESARESAIDSLYASLGL